MATAVAQRRWRDRTRFVKKQLNVTVRRLVHDDLDELAEEYDLRGKGEAVSFASFVTKGLVQYAEHDSAARHLLEIFAEAFRRDRDLYQ